MACQIQTPQLSVPESASQKTDQKNRLNYSNVYYVYFSNCTKKTNPSSSLLFFSNLVPRLQMSMSDEDSFASETMGFQFRHDLLHVTSRIHHNSLQGFRVSWCWGKRAAGFYINGRGHALCFWKCNFMCMFSYNAQQVFCMSIPGGCWGKGGVGGESYEGMW